MPSEGVYLQQGPRAPFARASVRECTIGFANGEGETMRGIRRVRAVGAVIVILLAAALIAPVTASAIPAPTITVYRFYNQSTGTHFYTASVDERDYVMATWPDLFTYEGPAFYLYSDAIDQARIEPQGVSLAPTTPVHRFFNVKNGSHFYTISADEAAMVLAKYPEVFRYDGVGFNAYLEQTEYLPLQPVHRFYNLKNGAHFYTISAEEKSLVQLYYADTYRYEGVAFYAMGVFYFN